MPLNQITIAGAIRFTKEGKAMCVQLDKARGTWTVMCRFKDLNGIAKRTTKRGFATEDDALEWEQLMKSAPGVTSLTVTEFYKIYERDIKPTVAETTWTCKDQLFKSKIEPYLGNQFLEHLSTPDILSWQNLMRSLTKLNGEPYSQTYLRTINNQLEAIFNHAVTHYNLSKSPMKPLRKMGKKHAGEMKFWTKDEYLKFSETIEHHPAIHCAFEILYWCGLRIGELLALTADDIDFNRGVIIVRKSFSKIRGKTVINPTKTSCSRRVVQMPAFLEDELAALMYLQATQPLERIFPFDKSTLRKHMDKGSLRARLPRIRIHDLRHSHVSLLINLGYDPLAIAERVGHSSISVTFRYAHLFPNMEKHIASSLEQEGCIR